MNENKLTFDQAFEIISKSYFLDELVGKSDFNKLKKKYPDLKKTSISNVLDIIPNLEDKVDNINTEDKFLTFQLLSDDEGGSESGPWYVTVHGVCGVWVVSSIEYDDEWYCDRNGAISAAYDYAHESIIEENDYGVAEFQNSNSEIDSQKQSQNNLSKSNNKKNNPGNRVLDFYYLVDDTNQKLENFKHAADVEFDILGLISDAFRSSAEKIEAALANAKKLSLHNAVKVLNIVIQEKKIVEDLNSKIKDLMIEIEAHKKSRITEIEVDDWCRSNGIQKPKKADFVKCAKDLQPSFRYRELFVHYYEYKPNEYKDAFFRLTADRKKIKDSRLNVDE